MRKIIGMIVGALLTVGSLVEKLPHFIAHPVGPHIQMELNVGTPDVSARSISGGGGVIIPLYVTVADQMPGMQDAVQLLLS